MDIEKGGAFSRRGGGVGHTGIGSGSARRGRGAKYFFAAEIPTKLSKENGQQKKKESCEDSHRELPKILSRACLLCLF